MRTRHAFTILELLVVVALIGMLLIFLLPALGAARRTARQSQSMSHVKSIHNGLLLFGQENQHRYPGLTPEGGEAAAVVPHEGDAGGALFTSEYGGYFPQARYAMLFSGGYVRPETAISPAEERAEAERGRHVTRSNYSYAMLNLAHPGPRVDDWAATGNAKAAVLADRNVAPAAGAAARSIHDPINEWRGSVGYNDNHVTFETANIVATQYGGAPTVDHDDLFAGDIDITASTPSDADAEMVFHDATTLVGQH